jgi:hypothetical protein
MKLRQIVDEKFKNTVSKLLDQDMPLKSTLVLKGVVELLNTTITNYETERQALLNQYGKKDEEGKLAIGENRHVLFDTDNMMAYSKAYNELCDREVDVPTLTAKELGDKVSLSHTDLLNLGGLVTA